MKPATACLATFLTTFLAFFAVGPLAAFATFFFAAATAPAAWRDAPFAAFLI